MGFDETTDATRRTRLANERTYLAWWRTGLTSIAVSVGVGRIVPGVAHVTKWPYELVGAGFGLLGIAFIVVGYLRVRAVERAVAQASSLGWTASAGGRADRRRRRARRRHDRPRRLRGVVLGAPRRAVDEPLVAQPTAAQRTLSPTPPEPQPEVPHSQSFVVTTTSGITRTCLTAFCTTERGHSNGRPPVDPSRS